SGPLLLVGDESPSRGNPHSRSGSQRLPAGTIRGLALWPTRALRAYPLGAHPAERHLRSSTGPDMASPTGRADGRCGPSHHAESGPGRLPRDRGRRRAGAQHRSVQRPRERPGRLLPRPRFPHRPHHTAVALVGPLRTLEGRAARVAPRQSLPIHPPLVVRLGHARSVRLRCRRADGVSSSGFMDYCGAMATPWNMVFAGAVATVVTGGDAEPSSTTTTSRFWVASPVVATRVTFAPVAKAVSPRAPVDRPEFSVVTSDHVVPSNTHFCTPPAGGERSSATYSVSTPGTSGLRSSRTNAYELGPVAVGIPGSEVAVWPGVVGSPVPTVNTFTNVPDAAEA